MKIISVKSVEFLVDDDPKEAARVYNEAALKHHGEFAVTNPIERLG